MKAPRARERKKSKFPLRTPQRPQPVFDHNRVFVHFILCSHECTHFAWPIHTFVEACGSQTLLGLVVRRYSCTVIHSVYICTIFVCYLCTHFAWPRYTYVQTCEIHNLFGSVVQLYSHNVIQSVHTCTAFCCY